MYHLLPTEDKKKIIAEYRARLLAGIFLLLSVSAAVLFAALIPSYFLASARRDAAAKELSAVSAKNDPDAENKLIAEIASARSEAILLSPLSSMTVFDALHSAVLKKPADIKLDGFYFKAQDTGVVHISGVADTREALARYENALRSERIFTSVELPISSFASSRDINFTIAASGPF